MHCTVLYHQEHQERTSPSMDHVGLADDVLLTRQAGGQGGGRQWRLRLLDRRDRISVDPRQAGTMVGDAADEKGRRSIGGGSLAHVCVI